MASEQREVVRQAIEKIREQARDEVEKGGWFENLTKLMLAGLPEYELDQIHHWSDWPQRQKATNLDGRDIGIDLVARRKDGQYVAIQCKFFNEDHRVAKRDIDSFLAMSQRPGVFVQRWIVTVSGLTDNARNQIVGLEPAVRHIDLTRHADEFVPSSALERPSRQLWDRQKLVVDRVVEGFKNHDRGRLRMACGTGKTFTSLRIAERVVANSGRILFLAPSIALVSQSRREWLRHTERPLRSLVVCSDAQAGGKKEEEVVSVSELACDVTTDPDKIAGLLSETGDATKVLFCTYQSLRAVINAQASNKSLKFDLVICDEAHRTTGISGDDPEKLTGFRAVHNDDLLLASKRLYMTATPRIYSSPSKAALKTKGVEVVDMKDQDTYGPEFDALKFKEAVKLEMLSDYRIIVLGVHGGAVGAGLRRQLIQLADSEDISKRGAKPLIVHNEDLQRVLATSLAINGITEGGKAETPKQLYRTIAFANTIAKSKFYAEALDNAELKKYVTSRKKVEGKAGIALKTETRHLDASHGSHDRLKALLNLSRAEDHKTARVLCNVGLFSEGVDVPSLDAVAFMEPRKSQIDVVQAVGRVMRKVEGKRLGYVIVPVPIESGKTLEESLESSGYKAVGQVLQALQSHDERLLDSPLKFIEVKEVFGPEDDGGQGDGSDSGSASDYIQQQLPLVINEVGDSVYAKVVASSGLSSYSKLVTDTIIDSVKAAAGVLMEGRLDAQVEDDFIERMSESLGEQIDNTNQEQSESNICKIAALLLVNACLLHKRLRVVGSWGFLPDMSNVAIVRDPESLLRDSWKAILDKDYKPVFDPALAVLNCLPENRPFAAHALRILAECAENTADELTDLGYDHAGPLYHKIMPHSESMGAFYTNNISALMLAGLAIGDNFVDWQADRAVSDLKIMDPACGTGTLLMAALKTIKERFAKARGLDPGNPGHKERLSVLHKTLVENSIYGLDINQCGIQLAASNLTLGAPTVDYQKMNLFTMKHGPQSDRTVKAGSLEILMYANQGSLRSLVQPTESVTAQGFSHVDDADASFPHQNIGLVIMNPPFTNNARRSLQYSDQDRKQMQQHVIKIQNDIAIRDPQAGAAIDHNSISTFFTPLADRLINDNGGVLARVAPVTACTNSSGLRERKLLADRFHIEYIITSHDPRCINFSENTDIHECLMVGQRHQDGPPSATEFISLKQMPKNPGEVGELIGAIKGEPHAKEGLWLSRTKWPAELVRDGDWSPAQWCDGRLAEASLWVRGHPNLEPAGSGYEIGPAGRRINDAYKRCDEGAPGAKPVFRSISSKIRQTMLSEPDDWQSPKAGKAKMAEGYWQSRSRVLLASRYRTTVNQLAACWSETASVGNGFVPMAVSDDDRGKALVAWWNSTPVMLMLLSLRSKTLDYPKWSLDQLRSIGIPKNDSHAWPELTKVFESNKSKAMFSLKDGERCEVRCAIDQVATNVLGVAESRVAEWRSMLAKEPTISGKSALDAPKSD